MNEKLSRAGIPIPFHNSFCQLKRLLFSLVILSLFSTFLYSEGSVDFIDYPGFRLFYGADVPQQLKVYAASGEFINVGTSHVDISGGTISVYRPDGSLHTIYDNTGETAGMAIIFNDIQEKAGPTGGGSTMGGGYIPGVISVGDAEAGIWTITFNFPNPLNLTFTNIMNGDPWTRENDQPTRQRGVLAWDVTVSQGGAGNEGGTLLEGRLYSNEYVSVVSRNNNPTSPQHCILTKDGFKYRVNFMDTDPYNFPLSSNNIGIVNGDYTPSYQSAATSDVLRANSVDGWLADSLYLYNPQAEDQGPIVNNKIFFNTPNPDMPSVAMTTDIFNNNTHETWLYNLPPVINLMAEPFQFTGANTLDPPCDDDSIEIDEAGYLSFISSLGGVGTLQLDLNADGDYNDAIDRSITQFVSANGDTIVWDGLDGEGNIFLLSDGFELNYQMQIRGGEIHILMEDVENSLGGVTFELINAEGDFDHNDEFYYDHSTIGTVSDVSGGGTPGNALPTTIPYTYTGGFGDEKILDYWTFVDYGESGTTVFNLDEIFTCVNEDDSDMDGIPDIIDIDDENDGVPDVLEYCSASGNFDCLPGGVDPSEDTDGDGIVNYLDADDTAFTLDCTDADGDGMCDEVLAIFDIDGDGVPNHLDLDSDQDGILDLVEAGHGQSDLNGDGIIDGLPAEFGDNGLYNIIASDPDSLDAVATYTPWDKDADGVEDYHDLDSDNDGIHDVEEAGYAGVDTDNDGRINTGLSNAQGLAPLIDPAITGFPVSLPMDNDNDGVPDWHDLDSDNDRIHDVVEGMASSGGPSLDVDNNGIVGGTGLQVDANGLGVMDDTGLTITTTSMPHDTDGDDVPDYHDLDSDNDGINDVGETGIVLDPDDDGIIGIGAPTVDEDGRAVNENDEFMTISFPKDEDSDTYPDYRDLDSDQDGITDVAESDHPDPDNNGIIGIGVPVVNENGQAIADEEGNVVSTDSSPTDTDGDSFPDYNDLDSDNDGIHDVIEGMQSFPNRDIDGDGIIGSTGLQIDSNGMAVSDDTNLVTIPTSMPYDTDGDGIPDFRDLDSDNDGIHDVAELGVFLDPDNDGVIGIGIPETDEDGRAVDENGDFVTMSFIDTDGDFYPDFRDLDSDNDGINDVAEADHPDTDGDGIIGTGVPTVNEHGQAVVDTEDNPLMTNSSPTDTDEDGIPDFIDLDTDGDGIFDVIEAGYPDEDNDGIIGTGFPIVNTNGQATEGGNGEPLSTTSDPVDTDGDGQDDYRDLDSDNGGISDMDECPNGAPCPDGDGNGTPDVLEVGCNELGDAPVITGVEAEGIFCEGNDITLTATNSNTDITGDIVYTWSGPNGFMFTDTVSADGLFIVVIEGATLANSGDYTLTVYENEECPATPEVISITINSIPATPTITTDSNLDCPTEAIVLNTTAYEEEVTYEWYFNGELLTTTTDTILTIDSTTITESGTYTVVTVAGDCSSEASEGITVTVGNRPVIMDISAVGLQCEGNDITLTATNSNTDITEDIVYTWSGPNGFMFTDTVSADTMFTVLLEGVTLAHSGDYTLTVYENEECPAPPETISITINSIPATPTMTTDSNLDCPTEDIVLNVNAYEEEVTYEWYFNDELLTTTTDTTLTVEASTIIESGTYTVVVVAGDCSSEASEGIMVTVGNRPIISDVSATGLQCVGNDITLTAINNNTDITGDLIYTWSGANGFMFTDTVPADSMLIAVIEGATLDNTGTYTLTVYENEACPATPEAILIAIRPIPATPTMTTDSNLDCPTEDIVLNVNAYEEEVTYEWYFNGELLTTTTDTTLTIAPSTITESGTYTVVAIVGDCPSEASEGLMVSIGNRPVITNVSPTDIQCEGNDIILSATNGNPDVIGDIIYTWSGPNGFMFTDTVSADAMFIATIENATLAHTGDYTLSLSENGACSGIPVTLTITVNPTPITPIITTDSNLDCPMETIVLNATAYEGDVSYEWYFNGELQTTTPGPILTIDPSIITESGTYTVIVVIGDCPSEASEGIMVSVGDVPMIVDLVPNSPICEGDDLFLSAANNNFDIVENFIYTWSGPNGFIFTDTTTIDLFVATIPNASPSESGDYTLSVFVEGGCSAVTNTISVTINPTPATPTITSDSNLNCPEEDIVLNTDAYDGEVTYDWYLDGNLETTTTEPSLIIIPLAGASGTYTVIANVNDCPSEASEGLVVNIITPPTIIDLSPSDIQCEGEDVILSASNGNAEITDDIIYTWSGPNGFMFTDTTAADGMFVATLSGASVGDSGDYTLMIVTENGCAAELATLDLTVNPIPAPPSVVAESNLVCLGEDVILFPSSYDGIVFYSWVLIGLDGNMLGNGTTSDTFIIRNSPEFTGTYFVTATVNGCTSESSEGVFVEIIEEQEPADISNSTSEDNPACIGDNVQLTAPEIEGATYEWSGPNGFMSTISNPMINPITAADAGDYTVMIMIGNCPAVMSNPTTVYVYEPVTPVIGNSVTVCEGENVTISVQNDLNLPANQTILYQWLDEDGNTLVTVDMASLTLDNVTEQNSSTYTLIVTVGDCSSEMSNEVEIIVQPMPTEEAMVIDEGLVTCDDSENTISAMESTEGYEGTWTSPTGATITSPNSAETTVSDLQNGDNEFVWTLTDPVCGDFSSASLIITKNDGTVTAADDALNVEANQVGTINVLSNDNTANGVGVTITSEPTAGTVTIDENGVATYTPNAGFSGNDSFTYQICNVECPAACDEATVTITVEALQSSCDVPNTFTPNNDAVNDTFIVPCLETDMLNNKVQIFNRWGDIVFETEEYRNDWAGTYEGEPLPPGVYFYCLFYDKNDEDPVQGYITIVR